MYFHLIPPLFKELFSSTALLISRSSSYFNITPRPSQSFMSACQVIVRQFFSFLEVIPCLPCIAFPPEEDLSSLCLEDWLVTWSSSLSIMSHEVDYISFMLCEPDLSFFLEAVLRMTLSPRDFSLCSLDVVPRSIFCPTNFSRATWPLAFICLFKEVTSNVLQR